MLHRENHIDRYFVLLIDLVVCIPGNAWFSKEEDVKGQIKEGLYVDLSILPDNLYRVSDEEIKRIESALTVVGGNIVYGTLEFQKLLPPVPKASPDWAPHHYYGC